MCKYLLLLGNMLYSNFSKSLAMTIRFGCQVFSPDYRLEKHYFMMSNSFYCNWGAFFGATRRLNHTIEALF